MKINKLVIDSYRNIKSITFIPDENINIIFGENAQGKTNLIEAIWLFTGAKSFRGNKDNELVNLNSEKAVLKCDFTSGNVEKNAELEIKNNRTAYMFSKKLSSPSKLVGEFNAVVFSPDDLEIVSSGPNKRRRFLDIAISQIYPRYIADLHAYNKALKQRTSILKSIKTTGFKNDLLPVFELEMVNYARRIIKARQRYIDKCFPVIKDFYFGISNKRENIEIKYNIDCEPDFMLSNLEKSRQKDMLTGSSGTGPHKDDIEFFINGLNAKSFASQGQKRSIAVSLKLTEAQIICNTVNEQPVLLLDDVLSELDEFRQDYILNKLNDRQVFITCCDTTVPEKLKKGSIFKIEKGNIV